MYQGDCTHSDEEWCIDAAGKHVNVAVAAYVTTQARLKLYECLSELGQSAFYCDADSVIFIQKDNDIQKSKQGIIWVT